MPLYIAPDLRTKFGRTSCNCKFCSTHCKIMPGMLGVGDFQRIMDFLHLSVEEADQKFLPSPGAKVLHQGKIRRIGTIVPARKEDGSCIFLQPDGLCSVHPVSPFGCSHFDSHMGFQESQVRSGEMLWQIDKDDQYKVDRERLLTKNPMAEAPEVLRARY